jgi:hypothetical protein
MMLIQGMMKMNPTTKIFEKTEKDNFNTGYQKAYDAQQSEGRLIEFKDNIDFFQAQYEPTRKPTYYEEE